MRGRRPRKSTGNLTYSIWRPVHLGIDETGADVHVTLAERNLLIGGEPGSGKSVTLNLIVAHAALSPDCRLILVDGKRVELGLWRSCAKEVIGPSIVDAIALLRRLQSMMDSRYDVLLDAGRRKIAAASCFPSRTAATGESCLSGWVDDRRAVGAWRS